MSEKQELAERRIVQVRDEEGTEPMDMEVFLELDHEERTYALITSPVPTVVLFEVDAQADEEAGEALNEADDETFAALKNDLNDFLKQWNVSISQVGTELRLSDELPEEVYADSPMLEIDSGEDDEPDSFLQLGEFDRGDKQYWLLMPTPPHLFAVELTGDSARFLDDEELEALQPMFDEAMEGLDEEFEHGGECDDTDCDEHGEKKN